MGFSTYEKEQTAMYNKEILGESYIEMIISNGENKIENTITQQIFERN